MIVEFTLPDLGQGLEEAEIVAWLVAEGSDVGADQPFVEVQTDKAVTEIPSPVAGRLVRVDAAEGEVVKVGHVLAVFETDDVGASPTPAPPASDGEAVEPAVDVEGRRPKASPAVRRLARDLGVDLAAVAGSGEGGRVVADDVRAAASPQAQRAAPGAVETAAAAGAPLAPGDAVMAPGGRIPLRGIRRRTAELMSESWSSIPHITGMDEFDATELLRACAALQPKVGSDGPRVTLLSFFVKAAALALRQFPVVNASVDTTAGEIVLHARRNVGVAAATPTGLVVPVVHDADLLPLGEIAGEVARLTAAARDGALALADLQDGTFTITNYGALGGGRFATPLIRPPEVAILGFGAIAPRPCVVDGQVVARPTLPYSFSADHRLIDGDVSLAFTSAVVSRLADPVVMLLDA